VAALEQVADKGPDDQKIEFKNFVNNFGTHFASTSHMGVRMISERRYSAKERANYDDAELKVKNVERQETIICWLNKLLFIEKIAVSIFQSS
jgi:hypothetical protein